MIFIDFNTRVNGKAAYSGLFILKDEVLCVLTGELFPKPTKFTIEIGKNEHILDHYGMYFNHSSDDPTVEINGKNVIALRDIMVGEEICFDYNNSETVVVSPFVDSVSGSVVKGRSFE
tara:strand:- start:5430 stop:5783 length:354 start_codon:yes stop_codon:yes gene_type:complete